MRHISHLTCLAALLCACAPVQSTELVDRVAPTQIAVFDARPDTPNDGRCWESVSGPGSSRSVETFTEVVPAKRNADGTELSSPVFRKTEKVVTTPGAVQYFERVCPNLLTQNFLAGLQRALIARDMFDGEVTRTLDPATGDAIRRYQEARGLNSSTLSIVMARRLGLIAIPRPESGEDA